MYRPFPIKALCVRHFLSLLVVIALGMTLPGGIGGCGGAVSNGEEESGAPTIASITGDGSSADIFEDSLVITGEDFMEDMTIELGSLDADESYSLTFTLDSPTQITADLPASLTAGNYEVVITTDAGSAIAAVTILRGETGPTGATGPQGPAGITIDAQFSCTGSSSDLDPGGDIRRGQQTNVTRFTDGSYFISCMTSILDLTLAIGNSDTSSYSAWYPPVYASTYGVISCIPFYVTAEYSIASNTVTYVNQADAAQTATQSCLQTYP